MNTPADRVVSLISKADAAKHPPTSLQILKNALDSITNEESEDFKCSVIDSCLAIAKNAAGRLDHPDVAIDIIDLVISTFSPCTYSPLAPYNRSFLDIDDGIETDEFTAFKVRSVIQALIEARSMEPDSLFNTLIQEALYERFRLLSLMSIAKRDLKRADESLEESEMDEHRIFYLIGKAKALRIMGLREEATSVLGEIVNIYYEARFGDNRWICPKELVAEALLMRISMLLAQSKPDLAKATMRIVILRQFFLYMDQAEKLFNDHNVQVPERTYERVRIIEPLRAAA